MVYEPFIRLAAYHSAIYTLNSNIRLHYFHLRFLCTQISMVSATPSAVRQLSTTITCYEVWKNVTYI